MKQSDTSPKKDAEISMTEMFRYLTGILEPRERRGWKILAVLNLMSPVLDLFSLSAVIVVINQAIQENRTTPVLTAFVLCMVGLTVFKCFLKLYSSKASAHFIYHGAQKLSIKMYETLIKEDLIAHSQKSIMQALDMVRHDTTNCVQTILTCVDIWISSITMAGFAVILIWSSKWVGAVSIVVLVALITAVHRKTRMQMRAYGEKTRTYSIRTNSQISIAFGSFKEMKIDDRIKSVLNNYQKASAGFAQAQGEYQYKSRSTGIVIQNIIMCAVLLMMAGILIAGTNLAAIFTPMLVYAMALTQILQKAFRIVDDINRVEFAKKPFFILREAMAQYEEVKVDEKRWEGVRRKELTFRQGLSVRNLTFGYNERHRIFENAAIDIPVGASVAIIGFSGAGKTTFLDLILGLLTPQEGSIRYDDYDIVSHTDGAGFCKANIGQLVSYIPQTVYLNGETIRHNVAFFEEEDSIDDAKVEECLKCVQIWEDIQRLPEGVDTLIGENGTTISGGQRQRVALARALYKDFELLIMDEATAALDMDTERAVIDSIRNLRAGKTLLMVTHHMTLADECDIIYKIDNKGFQLVKGKA